MDNTLSWLLVGAVFILVMGFHLYENRQVVRAWQSHLDAEAASHLKRFAWGRTFQLLIALATSVAIFIFYDHRLSEASRSLTAPKPVVAPQPVKPAPIVRPPIQPHPQLQNQPASLQNHVTPIGQAAPQKPATPALSTSGYYPPLVAQPKPSQPAPAQRSAPAAQVKPVPAISPRATINDVYNPEQKASGNEAAMDAIKKRYEGILVTYLFLQKCLKTGANDYNVILSALGREMASVNAPAQMQKDVVTSAQGSYKEMYSKSLCTDPSVANLVTQYGDYIKALSSNAAGR